MAVRVNLGILLAAAIVLGVSQGASAQSGRLRDAEEEKKLFESYFPDSNEAGQRLDEWWENKAVEALPPDEVLAIVRQGFRRTKWTRMTIIGWVGGRHLRHPEPEVRRKATDLLYYASFSPEGHVRHYAVYFGLSSVPEKSAELLARLAALAVDNESVSRIVWGVKHTKQAREFLLYVDPYLTSPDAEVRKRAEELKKLLKQETEHWETWRPTAEEMKPERRDDVDYETAFGELYETLGLSYPCFELKGIDWEVVGEEFLPRAKEVKTDDEFGVLCMELVARLEDSHAYLMPGAIDLPKIAGPQWDAGFSCLEDDQGRPAIYYVDSNGPADKAGVKVGMVVTKVDGNDVAGVIEKKMTGLKKYGGFSSERYLRYFAFHFFMRRMEKGDLMKFEMLDDKGNVCEFEAASDLGGRYLPRLPVPKEGIRDTANVSWKMLDDNIGYIYVRRIRDGLEAALDKAVGDLQNAHGLIVDVRGNTGGGFQRSTSHVNFYTDDDATEANRPRYKGPIALLIDNRCISAGEGWASWFIANKRAKLFGRTTAGASALKDIYLLKNGLYKVKYPIRPYTGFLDRPIERRGLEPDVEIKQTAADLAKQRDTVLEAAREYLLKQAPTKR
ncbi:MAG: hypothetical protein ISS79_00600 [Phycisphaerae bacterium]|nr:hypothetical protein [Phycisphaerae bacterium]